MMNLLNSTTITTATATALAMAPPPSFNPGISGNVTSVLTILGQTMLTYFVFVIIIYGIIRCINSSGDLLYYGLSRLSRRSNHQPDLEQGRAVVGGSGGGGGGGLTATALPREISIPYRAQQFGGFSIPNIIRATETQVIVRTPLFSMASVVIRYDESIDEDENRKLGLCGDCVICLEKFKHGDRCRVLVSCTHSYHKSCIDKWFTKNRHCPLCRVSVPGLLVARINRDDQV